MPNQRWGKPLDEGFVEAQELCILMSKAMAILVPQLPAVYDVSQDLGDTLDGIERLIVRARDVGFA